MPSASTRPGSCKPTPGWRAEKIKRLGTIDPSYPTAYALGVVYFRAARYDLSADSFTARISTWVIPEATQITILGRTRVFLLCTLWMK